MLKKEDGSNLLPKPTPEKEDGSNHLSEAMLKKEDGSNHLSEAMLKKEDGSNRDVWLYTVFEQELIIALGQYINNGNGQNSLYSFYTDFVEAVEQKNGAALKMKEAEKNLTLEDTHLLPAEITVDDKVIGRLTNALRKHFLKNAPWDLVRKTARELLHLHNHGKATTIQLREVAGLSVSGIAKHLPKLQRADLIKKHPPGNYALTEKSIHILLETFGVAKSK